MQAEIDEIKKQVFIKRPVLKTILDEHGHKSLLDYGKTFVQASTDVPAERKNEFTKTVAAYTSSILGPKIGEKFQQQLEGNYFVSTADHLGPLSSPFFLNSNMLAGLLDDPNLMVWPVFACSNVSLNNSSFPRGGQYHVQEKGHLQLKSFSFFPSFLRHASVFNTEAYDSKSLENIRRNLNQYFSNEDAENVIQVFGSDDILKLKNYSDQITVINNRLYKNFFGSNLRPPELLYLNQEEITIELLQHHLNDETEIHNLLFNSDIRRKVLEIFEGLPGSFSIKQQKGSFLFWGYDLKKHERIRLLENKGHLESLDGSLKIRLDPESIQKKLAQRELIPTMLLNLLLVAGYYGVKCLGGFSQTSYLTWMLEGYKKLFSKSLVRESQTMCGDFIFADIALGDKQTAAVTGMDILIYKDKFDPDYFLELCQTQTLSQVLDKVMPILFKILYPENSLDNWPTGAYLQDYSIDPTYANPIIKL